MRIKLDEIPRDMAAEGAVIGSMIVDGSCIPHVIEFLSASDFFSAEAKWLYTIICDLWREQQPTDAVMIRSRLPLEEKNGGDIFNYMVKAMQSVPSSANAVYYARIVHRTSAERKLIGIVESLNSTMADHTCPLEDKLSALAGSLTNLPCVQSGAETEKNTKLSELANKLLTDICEEGGLTTGLNALDNKINGFSKDDLILIAARPSMGKSSLALDFFIHACRIAARPYFYSLEMQPEKLMQRLIKNVARQKGKFFDKNSPDVLRAAEQIRKWDGWIEKKTDYKIEDICLQILTRKQKYNIGIAFVDYLQLIEGHGKSRYEQVTQISRELKKTATLAHIPIVALSQLNRACELRTNHRPILSDLRDSGSIEQDADVIMFLHREDYYRQKERPDAKLDGLAQLIISKNREGETGDIDLIWLPEFTSFAELNEKDDFWDSKNSGDNIPF